MREFNSNNGRGGRRDGGRKGGRPAGRQESRSQGGRSSRRNDRSGYGRDDGRNGYASRRDARRAGATSRRTFGSDRRDDRRDDRGSRDDRRQRADFSGYERRGGKPVYRNPDFRDAAGFGEIIGGSLRSDLLIGRNPVMEALRSGRAIEKIYIQKNSGGSLGRLITLAKNEAVVIEDVEKAALDRMAEGGAHQGVCAIVSAHEYASVEDLFAAAEERGEDPFFIILDGIEDPHNLGAVMRTAECAGAHGVIIPKRRAAGLTETVAKSSAGAIEYMPVARVTNIAQTIEDLKERGVWTFAVDMDGTDYTKQDLTGPMALVIGAEGSGISRLVKETCDGCVAIPMKGKINSLNASNAAAILMYEAVRQRTAKKTE